MQGAPGTGKTAVGLHRAAFLLYAHRDQLSRQGVLVVGPNASFLRYIGDVLPALGEIDAQQTTIEELVAKTLARLNARYAVRGADARRRRHAQGRRPAGRGRSTGRCGRRCGTRPRACSCRAARAAGGSRRTRSRRSLAELRARGVRYGAARGMLAQRLAHGILVKMEVAGDSPDDRVQDAVARSREVKQYVDQVWPAVDPARLVLRLLADAEPPRGRRRRAAHRRGAGAAAAGRSRPRRPASAQWSLADAVLIDEAADLVERTPVAGPRRRRRGAGPVADDAARGRPALLDRARRPCSATSPRPPPRGRPARGRTRCGHLGKADAHVEQLTKGFRVPGEVIEYAARLLPVIAPGLEPPTLGAADPRRARRRARSPTVDAELVPVESSRPPGGRVGSVGADRPGRARDRACVDALDSGRDRSRACSATSRPTCLRAPSSSTTSSTSCPPRWPRASSSTTWCCSSPPASSPARPTGSPACAGSTSASPARSPSLSVLHTTGLPAELGAP